MERLLADSEGYYGNNDKYNNQNNGKLKERLLQAPSGPEDGVSLTKYASQSPTPNLKQYNEY